MVGKTFICQKPYTVYVYGKEMEVKEGYHLKILKDGTDRWVAEIEEFQARGTIVKSDVPSDVWKLEKRNNIKKLT